MTGYFTGGLAWMHFGWLGVCAVGSAFVALALALHRSYRR